ncbi:Aerobic cobaltochelatase subunit CobN [Hartmannibacter diazotrophicus]|uniref:Aerobic cobaltochelatase subunit CobN n=1 Tax=Hartmannibacter diazotrophicus TaxID=1482074 RepID=A0A2C9D8W8_9HYPH|nr:cobaltochelatase subunit CobN [Hartmannibacter diazotrophicus]SON56598.1 Aerobic cobaltochelatase subunit CobN [Hartmannibacter diazotrophicus]
MHILATDIRSLDDTVQAVDLGQSAGEIVFLSFSDSDLALMAAAHEAAGPDAPSLRLAKLADLRHPYSVDLYLEKVAAKARFVLIRCLGGMDYWRYGIEELARAARSLGLDLAVVPGDHMEDPRLDEASTLAGPDLRRLWSWFQAGGPENARSALGWLSERLGRDAAWTEPQALPSFGIANEFCPEEHGPGAPRALIVFYRSLLAAADTAPIAALGQRLSVDGFNVTAVYVTSLKALDVVEPLGQWIEAHRPDVILNTTAFSAKLGHEGTVLDRADAPVIQVALAATYREAWQDSSRGLGAADFAMNVVLPEVDGRLVAGAISFKDRAERSETLEFARAVHSPDDASIAHASELAKRWTGLRRQPTSERRIALVLSDYPAKGGRTAYAVGLDGPASIAAIADDLRAAGYAIADLPDAQSLIRALESASIVRFSLEDYRVAFARLPDAFRQAVAAAWGESATDPAVDEDAFVLKVLEAGNLAIAVQPDRGSRDSRANDYHDPNLPPSHGYIAFYLWLAKAFRADAMIHLGTHGTLEWLPGKAVALSETCAPRVLTGSLPVIYPFIVNNPGEAAQAKRRIAGLTIGHLTPPLRKAGLHGATEEIEGLLDEFANAQTMDRRRAEQLADVILDRARESGLAEDCGLVGDLTREEALTRLDAWICDIKDMRIGDGLHVFGRAPEPEQLAETVAAIRAGSGLEADDIANRLSASANAERDALIAALSGRFVRPGPAGAPSRGRLDVLPTGRNLYTVDPRQVPTRTACEIGKRTADAVIARYLQDHGDWPRRIVIDLWGSASMRTGGDDLGQAFALLGVRPTWDAASARVGGFEVIPLATLGRPRVDVTLRISGLFRDVFETQIALFDAAVRAVAERTDEGEDQNPLIASAAEPRIFGAAPGAYGIGFGRRIVTGDWTSRDELAGDYLSASGHAYGAGHDGKTRPDALAGRIAGADAFVHVQDLAGQDILDADAFAEHEGGFAAAAKHLGAAPAFYHVDATRADASNVHTLREEVARVVRGRATNPRWLAGQMRHGHRGAAEIAETIGNLYALAATSGEVESGQFDRLYAATLGDEVVRGFMQEANPDAARSAARAFDEAQRRGLWLTRRNSIAADLAEMLEATR